MLLVWHHPYCTLAENNYVVRFIIMKNTICKLEPESIFWWLKFFFFFLRYSLSHKSIFYFNQCFRTCYCMGISASLRIECAVCQLHSPQNPSTELLMQILPHKSLSTIPSLVNYVCLVFPWKFCKAVSCTLPKTDGKLIAL